MLALNCNEFELSTLHSPKAAAVHSNIKLDVQLDRTYAKPIQYYRYNPEPSPGSGFLPSLHHSNNVGSSTDLTGADFDHPSKMKL